MTFLLVQILKTSSALVAEANSTVVQIKSNTKRDPVNHTNECDLLLGIIDPLR